jgi:tRNA G18 (ribose-2'-O)-methylase SpoU
MTERRGYFEIGVYHPKTEMNIGTLMRSAYQLGAAGVFTIGARYRPQPSDTLKAYRHIPVRNFATFAEFQEGRPYSARLVGIEMGGKPLGQSSHPQQAIYLLGAEDNGLPKDILAQCQQVISLESLRTPSYNVAVAGSLVMYHRAFLGNVSP